jgi:hypothetical protein
MNRMFPAMTPLMPFRSCGLAAMLVPVLGGISDAEPWWDRFPRMINTENPADVLDMNGTFAMNGNGNDPSWGTFFQAGGIRLDAARIASFQTQGLRQIGYFETYGNRYCLAAELGAWNETSLTPVLHTHWSWKKYGSPSILLEGLGSHFEEEVVEVGDSAGAVDEAGDLVVERFNGA